MPGNPAAFGPEDTVLIGRRHLRAGGRPCFAGEIEDARIYDRDLTAEQVAALQPNQPSEPKPWAWWTFEDGRAEDLMRTFPASELVGGARIERGRLILDGQQSYAVFRQSAASAAQPK
jgi:hypothetical protein